MLYNQQKTFAMPVGWSRLIRFLATDGRVLRGEPIFPSADFDLGNVTEKDQLQAKIIHGDDIFGDETKVTEELATVKEMLGPLTPADVPTIRCIGLNYRKHSAIFALCVSLAETDKMQ